MRIGSKLIATIVILGSLYLVLGKGLPTPYSGEYTYLPNSNIQLKLNNDNSFELHDTLGKYDSVQTGRYEIADNVLKLEIEADNGSPHPTIIRTGHVDGSRLTLDGFEGAFMKQ